MTPVIVFIIGNTIQKAVVTVTIGNYIHGVIVLEGSLYSQEYGIMLMQVLMLQGVSNCYDST